MSQVRRQGPIVTTVLLFAFALSGSLAIAAAPASQSQNQREKFVPDEVIVRFKAGVSESDKATARAAANAVHGEQLLRSSRGDLELTTVPGGLPLADAIRALKNNPNVVYAEPNWIYTHSASSNDPFFANGSLWGMYGDASNPSNQFGSQAAEAWAAGYTGTSSVLVGVIDEGIDFNRRDLAANH